MILTAERQQMTIDRVSELLTNTHDYIYLKHVCITRGITHFIQEPFSDSYKKMRNYKSNSKAFLSSFD